MYFLPSPRFLTYLVEFKRSPLRGFKVLPKKIQFLIVTNWITNIATLAVFLIGQALGVTINQEFVLSVINSGKEPQKEFQQLSRIPIPTPTKIPSLVPVELHIPKLQITTDIEAVGQTKKLTIDVPKNAAHVAWYVYGAKPGEEGNAVINGHYDTPSGSPAVFYRLRLLEPGDEIMTVSEDGIVKQFIVTSKERHPYQTFPNQYVLFTKPGKNLNLITCDGIWDTVNAIYNDRLVVYASLKEG